MPFRLRLTLIFFAVLLVTLVTVPLIVPVPELTTVSPRTLAQDGDEFTEVDGVDLRYTDTGDGPPTLVLLHGFGSSLFSWRNVTEPLGERARVVAFDRPGFGLSERPDVTEEQNGGRNPYTQAAQVDLTVGLMDALGIDNAILVGHAAGAAVAVEVALTNPERVAGLVLASPSLTSGGPPGWVRALYNTPQADRMGPYLMRQFGGEPGLDLFRRAYADPERLTDADIAGYRLPLQADGWDRALWEVTKATRPDDLYPRLAELDVPTLVVSGEADELVPPAESERAAGLIDGAEYRSLAACGHALQEECSAKFSEAVTLWLDALQGNPFAN